MDGDRANTAGAASGRELSVGDVDEIATLLDVEGSVE